MERRRRWCLISVGLCVALAVLCGTALADPVILPPITAAGKPQSFTLIVPEEHEPNGLVTKVEFFPPPELRIRSFSETDGWKRDWTIVSLDVTVQKATWTRVSELEEDPYYAPDPAPNADDQQNGATKDVRFRFVAVPAENTSYPIEVRETYSTGRVIDWTGPASRAFPSAPPGTELRPPIVLQSSVTGDRPYGWIAAALVGILAVALGFVVRARAGTSRS